MSPWKTFQLSQYLFTEKKKNHADLIWKLPEIVWISVVFLSCNRGLLLERSGAGPLWHNYSRSILSITFTNGAVHPFSASRLGGKCSRTRVQCETSGGNEAIRFHLPEGHLTYMCCWKSDTFFLSACLYRDLSVSLLKMQVNAHILYRF